MYNPEKLETLGTQDTERRQTKTNKHNTKYQNDEQHGHKQPGTKGLRSPCFL